MVLFLSSLVPLGFARSDPFPSQIIFLESALEIHPFRALGDGLL